MSLFTKIALLALLPLPFTQGIRNCDKNGVSPVIGENCYTCVDRGTEDSCGYYFEEDHTLTCLYYGEDYTETSKYFTSGNRANAESETTTIEHPLLNRCNYDTRNGTFVAHGPRSRPGTESTKNCPVTTKMNPKCAAKQEQATNLQTYYRCASGDGCTFENTNCFRCPKLYKTTYVELVAGPDSGSGLQCNYPELGKTCNYSEDGKLAASQPAQCLPTATRGLECTEKKASQENAAAQKVADKLKEEKAKKFKTDLAKGYTIQCKAKFAQLKKKKETGHEDSVPGLVPGGKLDMFLEEFLKGQKDDSDCEKYAENAVASLVPNASNYADRFGK